MCYIMKFLALLLVYAFQETNCKILGAGEYKIEITQVEYCPDYSNKVGIPYTISWHVYNRTNKALDLNIDLRYPLDEKIDIHLDIERWGDGGWKKNAIVFHRSNACDSLKAFLGGFWTDLVTELGVKEPEKCPIPPGKYGLKNYLPVYRDVTYIPWNDGKYRFNYKFFKQSQVQMCIIGYVSHVQVV